jgi:hypothetical protein
MTRFFGQVDFFRLKGQGLAKILPSLEGMHLLYTDGLLTGFPSRVFMLFLLSHSTMHRVFRRLCLSFLRGNFPVPRIASFGPAAPSKYSR